MCTSQNENRGIGLGGGSVQGQRDLPGSGLGGRYKGHCGDPLSHNSTPAECPGTLGGFDRSGTHPVVGVHHSCGVPIRGVVVSRKVQTSPREHRNWHADAEDQQHRRQRIDTYKLDGYDVSIEKVRT